MPSKSSASRVTLGMNTRLSSRAASTTAPTPPAPAKDDTGPYGLFALFALIPLALLVTLIVKCVWRRKVEELEQQFSAKLADMEQSPSSRPDAAPKMLILSASDVDATREGDEDVRSATAVSKTRKSTIIGEVSAPVDSPFLTSV